MPREFFDPTPEQQNVILIDALILRKAEKLIESCEHCNPDAEIPFDNVLRPRHGLRSERDGIHPGGRSCPNCKREIFEKTLVAHLRYRHRMVRIKGSWIYDGQIEPEFEMIHLSEMPTIRPSGFDAKHYGVRTFSCSGTTKKGDRRHGESAKLTS